MRACEVGGVKLGVSSGERLQVNSFIRPHLLLNLLQLCNLHYIKVNAKKRSKLGKKNYLFTKWNHVESVELVKRSAKVNISLQSF